MNLHWGIEYQLKPVASQRTLADWLVAQGVDLIIGGHPHVVEPMEVRYSQEHDKNVLLVCPREESSNMRRFISESQVKFGEDTI